MQFSVLMELQEKCMIRIFPFMKIEWLAFLVNPRIEIPNDQPINAFLNA